MVVQNQSQMGEGSVIPTDPHRIPTYIQPFTQPQKTQKPKKPKRKDTQVSHPSDHIESVADEAVYKELGDSLVRTATTASSLEAEQDSGNITKTRSKATPNESISQGTNSGGGPRGNTLQSDEDRLKLEELMTLCTNLQNMVLELEKTKNSQHNEIASLKRRVKKLENKNRSRTHKLKRLYKVGLTARVSAAGDIVSTASAATTVSAATTTTATINTIDDITLARALEEMKSTKPKKKGIVIQELGKMDADHLLAESRQAQSTRRVIYLKEKATLFHTTFREKMISHLQLKRAKRKETKFHRTKAQQRKIIAFKRVNTFEDFRTELVEGKEKSVGTGADEEEVAIDAIPLAVKSPSIDLKTMFKPHVEDKVWKNQQDYKVLNWKLYNSCRVHFLRMQHMQIYMLVEKKYPLTPSTLSMMFEKKLMTDYESKMAYQLLKFIIKQLKK
ncbi:hypothetical protein Tco_0712711 [Tanacetum coccineum]